VFRIIEEALANARERFGFPVIEFSVLGNHLHLNVRIQMIDIHSNEWNGGNC